MRFNILSVVFLLAVLAGCGRAPQPEVATRPTRPAHKAVAQSNVDGDNVHVDETPESTSRHGQVVQNNVNGNNVYDGGSKQGIGRDGAATQNNINGNNTYVAEPTQK